MLPARTVWQTNRAPWESPLRGHLIAVARVATSTTNRNMRRPSVCSLSIYKGDVVLRNLQLKADALEGLDLPVTVRAGLLGSLTLKVPWSSLGTVPVEAKIDRLYLLASPKTEEERGKGVKTEVSCKHMSQVACNGLWADS